MPRPDRVAPRSGRDRRTPVSTGTHDIRRCIHRQTPGPAFECALLALVWHILPPIHPNKKVLIERCGTIGRARNSRLCELRGGVRPRAAPSTNVAAIWSAEWCLDFVAVITNSTLRRVRTSYPRYRSRVQARRHWAAASRLLASRGSRDQVPSPKRP